MTEEGKIWVHTHSLKIERKNLSFLKYPFRDLPHTSVHCGEGVRNLQLQSHDAGLCNRLSIEACTF